MRRRSNARAQPLHRRWRSNFARHNGNVDAAGNPTIANDKDWEMFIVAWPCEIRAVSGGMKLRGGRQVSADATHILYGEIHGANDLLPEDRAILSDGRIFEVIYTADETGFERERVVEIKVADSA